MKGDRQTIKGNTGGVLFRLLSFTFFPGVRPRSCVVVRLRIDSSLGFGAHLDLQFAICAGAGTFCRWLKSENHCQLQIDRGEDRDDG